MKMDIELICRIKHLMEENGYNANSFSKKVDIDPGNLRKKLKGEYGITNKDIFKISKYMGVNQKWLKSGEGNVYADNTYSVGRDINIGGHVEKSIEGALGTPDNAFAKVSNLFIGDESLKDKEIGILREQIKDMRKQLASKDAQIKQLLDMLANKQ